MIQTLEIIKRRPKVLGILQIEFSTLGEDKGKNVNLPPVKIGDVVILHDQKTTQRAFWKVARVAELVEGRDGEVRGARVLVVRDVGGKSLIKIPLQKLFPLEVQANNTDSANQTGTTTDETCEANEGTTARQTKTCRTAAVVAEKKMKLIDH